MTFSLYFHPFKVFCDFGLITIRLFLATRFLIDPDRSGATENVVLFGLRLC